jgi:hypothetical protein
MPFMSKSELGKFTGGCDYVSSFFRTLRIVLIILASGALPRSPLTWGPLPGR